MAIAFSLDPFEAHQVLTHTDMNTIRTGLIDVIKEIAYYNLVSDGEGNLFFRRSKNK